MGEVIESGYTDWVKENKKEEWDANNSDRTQNCKTCFYRPQNELLEWISNGKLDIAKIFKEYQFDHPKTLHKDFV